MDSHHSEKAVLLTGVVCDAERMQVKVSRGERHLGEAQETPGTSFRPSLPTESRGDTLNSPNNVETGAKRSQPGTVP